MNTSSSGFASLTADSAAKLIEQRKKEILKTFGIESSEDFQLNQFTYHPYTISSGDSGIISTQSSAPIANNYYNMNMRNCQTMDTNSLTISDEISQKKQPNSDLFKKQQKFDLFSYLNGQIDQDEYKRRLSANLSILNNSNITKGKDINQLFGLELFDESDNLRDNSLEKLIGISIKNINSMTPLQIKSNLIHSPSSSSNDTLNDQDEDSSFNNFNRNNNNNNNSNNLNNNNSSDNEESEDEDISRDLLISLLNNRQSKVSSNNSHQLIEMKKQFIQSQLDSVRRQKELLNNKNNRLLNSGLPPQPPPPQSKIHQRLVNELNSHELSTIKEVDTPKSERNFKLTSNKYKNTNDSSIDLSTSLESVTQLSNEKSSSVDSMTTSMVSFNKNNKSSSSSTPISTQTPYHNPQLLDINLIRQKQKELFNMSLFESSSSDNSSLISPNNTKNKNLVQYAAKIYDSLSSTNLSISAMNNNSTLNNSLKQKVAFKTESTTSIDQSSINNSNSNNNSSIINISNNKSSKKWFDILASEEDTVNMTNKTNDKQDDTILSQHPLSDTSSSEEDVLENTYNNNTNKELEKTLQPVKYSPPKKQNNCSLSMQSLSLASNSSMSSNISSRGSGMFDKFLKNYTSQTCAASVMDEPEISFVSTVNSSTTNSPQKNGGGINILVKNLSNNTCSSSSYTSCNETASTSFSNNSNLIQLQQKHLSKKFANMSPIETNSLNNQNNPQFSMTNSTISNFTLFEQTSKINEDEQDDNKSTKSSLILLSPNKIYNEKSTSLVHGLINDDDEEISQSFIEGALQAPFEFNKFKKYRDENDEYLSDSLVSFEQHEISQLTQTTLDQQNLSKTNSSRSSSVNSTNEETTIENNKFFLSNLTAEHTQNISKMFDKFKEKINNQKRNDDKNKDNKKHLKYSTPKIAITKSYQSSITNVTNYELEGDEEELEEEGEISSLSKSLANLSAVSSTNNSSFMSQASSIFKKPKDDNQVCLL